MTKKNKKQITGAAIGLVGVLLGGYWLGAKFVIVIALILWGNNTERSGRAIKA